MPEKNTLELKWLKSKNRKVKSSYLHLCYSNVGRSRALATFTVPAMTAKKLQLLLIKEIKNYFSKKLQNLKSDVQYFAVIELGQYKSNPHLHVQLFYDEEDIHKVKKAYRKTIEYFSLVTKRCKLVEESGEDASPLTFNYIIKEYDNLKLSDKEILALDAARKRLKQGETKHIQFFSKSRALHPHPLYSSLWFKHQLKYKHVNHLMNHYATRLSGMRLLKARRAKTLPYMVFKGGAIQINIFKLYLLSLFTLLYLKVLYYSKSRTKYIYNNKRCNDTIIVNKIYFINLRIKNIINSKYEFIKFSFF